MFDFNNIFCARTLDEALQALTDNPTALIISGGTDVLIKLREGQLNGASLVSINGIPELRGVYEDNGRIVIKPCTTFTEINTHPLIRRHMPILAKAVDEVGGPQIRNVGTIGGNISNGVTSADSAPSLFALNASVELTSKSGSRVLPIADYYVSAGRVALKPGELLTAIIIEKDGYENTRGHYIKYAMRDAMDIATLGCAVVCRLSTDKNTLDDIRLAYGVAAPVPIRCPKTEASVTGMKIGRELFQTLAHNAAAEANPRTSWRASREFRLNLVQTLSVRALKEAIKQAGGETYEND